MEDDVFMMMTGLNEYKHSEIEESVGWIEHILTHRTVYSVYKYK